MIMDKIEVLIGIHVKLPEPFSLEVDQDVLDLKKSGIKTTKAELIARYAQFGRIAEKKINNEQQ